MCARPPPVTVAAVRRLLHRLRTLPLARADRGLAFAALVVTEAGVLLDPHVRSLTAVVLAVPFALAVLRRRRRPLAMLSIALGAQLVDALIEPHHLAVSSAGLLVMLVLVYSLGRHAGRRELAAGAALMVACALLDAVYAQDGFLNELAFDALIATALPIVAGRVLRRRAELIGELRVQHAQLERERDGRVQDAAAAERVRIASELHDVVVHDVSAMVIQAAAARLVVRSRPADAVEAIARVEGAGREALDELRRALGVLRVDDGALALQPQPTAARLPELVAAAGARLAVDPGAELDALPSDLQLTAYRIVQDLLIGIEDGVVRLARSGGAVVVEVSHRGVPPAAGALDTARRRVALFGGDLDTAAGDTGGCRVRARLPLPVASP